MLHLTKRHFWWPNKNKDVKDFVAACSTCARNKNNNKPPAGRLLPLPSPSRPWSHIALDFVTGLPPSAICTIIDRFSKSAHFIPVPKLPSALEMVQIIVNHVFCLHGIPTDIVSDRGPQFISQVWKFFCQALGSTSFTSGYHPQSNGQTERCNQELEASLRCVIESNPSTWCQHLPCVEYTHNSQVSLATGVSPFEASLGYSPPLFPAQEAEVAVNIRPAPCSTMP